MKKRLTFLILEFLLILAFLGIIIIPVFFVSGYKIPAIGVTAGIILLGILLYDYRTFCSEVRDPAALILTKALGRTIKPAEGGIVSPLKCWKLAKDFHDEHLVFCLKHLGYLYVKGRWYRFIPAECSSSEDLNRVFWHPDYVNAHLKVLSVKGSLEKAMSRELLNIARVLFEFDYSRFNFGQQQAIRRLLKIASPDLNVEEKIQFLMKYLPSGSTRTALIKYFHVVSSCQTKLSSYG